MKEKTLEEKILEVPSQNQMRGADNIWFFGAQHGSPRILFLGNSITLHAPKPEIGWFGNWGMAASSREKDYVHLVAENISEKWPQTAFCIAQGAVWETTLEQCDYERWFAPAKAFEADVILSTLEANISIERFEAERFLRETRKLHHYLMKPDGTTKIIIASSIGNMPERDTVIERYAGEAGAQYVYIGDIFADKRNLAIGQYAHEGVAHHPSDIGMLRLAERYTKALEQAIADSK